MSKKLMGQVPNRKSHQRFTNITVLEFGSTSSSKSYTVTREAHSSGAVTRIIKSSKKWKKAKSKFGLDGKGFWCKTPTKIVSICLNNR
jgi:hypothetical protein